MIEEGGDHELAANELPLCKDTFVCTKPSFDRLGVSSKIISDRCAVGIDTGPYLVMLSA